MSTVGSIAAGFSGNPFPGVAQIGSALEWGSRGRWFDSSHSDQEGVTKLLSPVFSVFMRVYGLFRADFSKPLHRGCPTPKRAKTAKNRLLVTVNCTLFVRQYDILNNKWGDFMTKGIGNKRYTPEFKKIVVETMREEGLSYKETRLRFDIAGEDRVRNWERIYLEEGPEGLAVERRGRKITGRPRKLPQSTEEDTHCRKSAVACRGSLPKKFASLGFGARATPAERTLVVQI